MERSGSVCDSTGNDGAGVSEVRDGRGSRAGGGGRVGEKKRRRLEIKDEWLCHALRL